jgi:hypothetical protein
VGVKYFESYREQKLNFKNDGPKTLINFNMVDMKPNIAMLLKTCILAGERSVTQNTCHVEYTFFNTILLNRIFKHNI